MGPGGACLIIAALVWVLPGAASLIPSMAIHTSAKSRLLNWYARLVAFNVEDLFSGKRSPGPPRTVLVNEPLPESFFDIKGKIRSEHVYTSNQVITSKYSLITFLPRNLFEQFRRIANMYVHLNCLVVVDLSVEPSWPTDFSCSSPFFNSFPSLGPSPLGPSSYRY